VHGVSAKRAADIAAIAAIVDIAPRIAGSAIRRITDGEAW
jgi:hypothetical protein